MLVPPESSSAVLVTMRNKSVSISAIVLLLDWTTVAETALFEGGIPKFDAFVRRTA